MNKNIIFLGILGVVILFGGILLLNNSASTPTDSQVPANDTSMMVDEKMVATDSGEAMMDGDEMMEGDVYEITIEGKPFEFTPNEFKVKKGQTVRVTFKNMQGVHDFVIDEFSVATKQINAEEEEVVEFVADEAGEFSFYCSVPGHRTQGMEGTLTVEE